MSAELSGVEEVDENIVEPAVPQYLTFVVANEVYGLPISCVAEIIGTQRFTPVPDARDFMRGVINLRGTVIPVMDVRVRVALEARPVDGRTCIIVVQREGVSVGLLVDTIADVIDVPAGSVEAAPRRVSSDPCAAIVTGLVQVDGEVKILIDLGRLLHGDPTLGAGVDSDIAAKEAAG